MSVFILASVTHLQPEIISLGMDVILKSLFLIPQDSNVIGGTGAPVIIVAWSLQYEIAFYACFALALIRKWLFYSLVIIYAINFLLEPILGPYSFPRSFFSSHLILLFGIGILTSVVTKFSKDIIYSRLLALFAVIIFIFNCDYCYKK